MMITKEQTISNMESVSNTLEQIMRFVEQERDIDIDINRIQEFVIDLEIWKEKLSA